MKEILINSITGEIIDPFNLASKFTMVHKALLNEETGEIIDPSDFTTQLRELQNSTFR